MYVYIYVILYTSCEIHTLFVRYYYHCYNIVPMLCSVLCFVLFSVENHECIVAGTLYKEMKLKPNILDELSHTKKKVSKGGYITGHTFYTVYTEQQCYQYQVTKYIIVQITAIFIHSLYSTLVSSATHPHTNTYHIIFT